MFLGYQEGGGRESLSKTMRHNETMQKTVIRVGATPSSIVIELRMSAPRFQSHSILLARWRWREEDYSLGRARFESFWRCDAKCGKYLLEKKVTIAVDGVEFSAESFLKY